jgi:hypothetical protein
MKNTSECDCNNCNELDHITRGIIVFMITFGVSFIFTTYAPIPITITEHNLDYIKTIQTGNPTYQDITTSCFGLTHYIIGSCLR